jgi:hypothetical protein
MSSYKIQRIKGLLVNFNSSAGQNNKFRYFDMSSRYVDKVVVTNYINSSGCNTHSHDEQSCNLPNH